MLRLIKAFENSLRAFRRLLAAETAFQQEVVLLLAALPAGWFLSTTWPGYALLIGSILLLIEAACDAFSREFNVDIQLAKDCGSLAVLISILIACGVWLLAIVERAGGLAG